jgi:hypothetical protein
VQIYKKKQTHKVSRKRGIIPQFFFFIGTTLLVSIKSFAAGPLPLGLPQNTAKIGYSAGVTRVSVSDPDGPTKSNIGAQPFGLIYTDWFLGGYRYWSEAYYYSATLDDSGDNVGQDVERYGLRFSLQKNFRILQSWAPWLGAGLDLSQAKYTLRHTKDSEGYLLDKYPDRSEVAVSLLVNAVSEWSIARDWSLAFKLEQSIPLSSDVSEFLVSGVLLYRY